MHRANIELKPTPELNEAFADFQANVTQPKKTKQGHFGKYADLADIATAVNGAAPQLGLSYTQEVMTDIDANGKRMSQVVTHIMHKSGESMTVEGTPVEIGTNPQQMLANLTYARRGSLATAFGLVADEEDDGEQITALAAEQAKQENMRRAMLAKLKEKLKDVPKGKEEMVYATVGLSSAKANAAYLDKLDANKISILAGAAMFAINDHEVSVD